MRAHIIVLWNYVLCYSFYLFLLFCPFIALQSQVIIGGGRVVNKGAILELKQTDVNDSGPNATKGLMLPRVTLQAINLLPPDGASFTGDDVHIGLVVYNLTIDPENSLCKSPYVWTGAGWQILGEECECQLKLVGDNGNNYYVKCITYQAIRANVANTCSNLNKDKTGKGYHAITHDEYMQIWNKTASGAAQKYFKDGDYHLTQNNWITLAEIASNDSSIALTGFAFPGGAPIGGAFSETETHNVVCVRD